MDESDIDFRGVIGLLRRRLRLIAITFATTIALAGLVILATPQVYTASTLILFDAARPNLLDPAGTSLAMDHGRIDSEVEILSSDTVLLDVIAALNLSEDPEFGAAQRLLAGASLSPLQEALARLKAATSIQRRGLTYLMSVSMRSRDPARAALIANTIAETYIKIQLRAKVENRLAAQGVLAAQTARARADLVVAEQRFEAFLASHPGVLEASDLSAETLADLLAFRHAAEHTRTQYRDLLARSETLSIEAELQLSDSRIVSRAKAPGAPSFPNALLILALAGLGGLGLGVVLALIRENFARGFTSDFQLATITRKPSLGDIPLEPLAAGGVSVATLMVEAPLSPFAESVRRIRAGIDQHLDGSLIAAGRKRARVVMVSSSVTEEGKTALALSLARAYAASGKKTLVIDCDLRQPSLHRHLDVRPDIGLLDYLADGNRERSFAPMIVLDAETGLSALVGARGSEIPTDQLFSGLNFGRLLAAAIANFDVVILDTPPLLPVVDGLYLARHADIVLFVVKWSSTAQSLVRSAIGRLDAVRQHPAPILTVLNQQADPFPFAERRYRTYPQG